MKQSTSSRGFLGRWSRDIAQALAAVGARSLYALIPLALSIWLASPAAQADDDSLSRQANWDLYGPEEMEQMLRSGLTELGVSADEAERLAERFSEPVEAEAIGRFDYLQRFVDVIRSVAPLVEELVAEAEKSPITAAESLDPSGPRYAALESLPAVVRMSVRTWLGREMVQQRLYDEALPVLAEVDLTDSIAPASVLFYRGVCYHSLLLKEEALSDLRRLLQREETAPVRFVRTSQLMVADLQPLEEDSLDEISRLMTDVTRRLDLGRADEQVKDQEQTIIDKLTKLIDEIEEQQQQQQQQQQGGGGQGGSDGGQDAPMQDSQIAGGSGAGDVDRKRIEQRDGWGNLPPAERQQALQQISQDLPTHYREAIEAYFRKLATEDDR